MSIQDRQVELYPLHSMAYMLLRPDYTTVLSMPYLNNDNRIHNCSDLFSVSNVVGVI